MKLIDILVEELPKNGGWPDGIEKLEQYPDGSLFCGTKYKSDFKFPIVDDYGDDEVTRAEYEAALAVKNEGWIEWGGGECPVSDSTIVEVRYRNGEVKAAAPADFYEWGHWRPHFVTTGRDIIAYRLHKLQEAEQAKADEEADLNECIGQDAAPVWSGEGQPPVGCECEFMKHTLDAMPNWRRGIIKYVSEYTVVIVEALSPGEFVSHPRTCDFRPLRTKAERKRDEAVKSIMLTGWCQAAAEEIYDLVAAGKVPGMKLED